MLEISDSKG